MFWTFRFPFLLCRFRENHMNVLHREASSDESIKKQSQEAKHRFKASYGRPLVWMVRRVVLSHEDYVKPKA